MLDQRMRALARHVEDGVEMPDLAGLVDRGVVLRRRRRRVVAAALVSCLVAVGYLTTLDREPSADPPPAVEPESSARYYPGGIQPPELEAGTYAINVATDRGEVTAEVTVPDGWRGWIGPHRPFRTGVVSLLVQDVAYVTETPCRTGVEDMTAVGDAPADLVRALTRIPGHELVVAPEPDDRFGVPATHLVLQSWARLTCPDSYFGLWSTGGTIPIWSLGPDTRMELWVLDVDGEAVLVSALSTPDVPARGLRELAEVVESVEILH